MQEKDCEIDKWNEVSSFIVGLSIEGSFLEHKTLKVLAQCLIVNLSKIKQKMQD